MLRVLVVLCSTAAALAANATAANASCTSTDEATAADGRRLSTASFLRAHPTWRPPPPPPPSLDSLTGEHLDGYLSSLGVEDTQLSSTGLDGAAVDELLKVPAAAASQKSRPARVCCSTVGHALAHPAHKRAQLAGLTIPC